MVSKLKIQVRRGSSIFMAVLGFFLVFFFSNFSTGSNGAAFGTIAHADTPVRNGHSGPGCCGSCGDGSSSDCGGGTW